MISFNEVSYAKEFESAVENSNETKVQRYIQQFYDQIKFPKGNKLSFQAFKHGFYGYLNLVEAGKINPNSLLTICDFTLSSNIKRMWVIDTKTKKVVFNTLVAHGMATGEEYATAFSNIEESHQSSLGFYITAETYLGNNGYSLKLNGIDGSFNNKAYDRAIVIHGADYVSEEYARCNKRIGRSHGCPALPVDIAPKVIDKIKNGTCLFIYSASKNYLTNSYWLRNRIKQLPQEADRMDLLANLNRNSSKMDIDDNQDLDAKQTNACAEEMNAIPKQEESPVYVSESDKKMYRVEVQTTIIKKGNSAPNTTPKNISSIMVINENNRLGTSDTLMVK